MMVNSTMDCKNNDNSNIQWHLWNNYLVLTCNVFHVSSPYSITLETYELDSWLFPFLRYRNQDVKNSAQGNTTRKSYVGAPSHTWICLTPQRTRFQSLSDISQERRNPCIFSAKPRPSSKFHLDFTLNLLTFHCKCLLSTLLTDFLLTLKIL